jgi:hypothetical protein
MELRRGRESGEFELDIDARRLGVLSKHGRVVSICDARGIAKVTSKYWLTTVIFCQDLMRAHELRDRAGRASCY